MRTISILAATAVLSFGATAALAQSTDPAGRSAAPQKHKSAYCLIESRTGSNCTFETLAACLKNKTGISDMCDPNPGSETTGSGIPGDAVPNGDPAAVLAR